MKQVPALRFQSVHLMISPLLPPDAKLKSMDHIIL